MKHNCFLPQRVTALFLAMLLPILCFAACSDEAESSAASEYTVSVGGVTLRSDMEMSSVLAAISETYTCSESSACPPFEGIEKLYEFQSVKITTYSENGTDRVMSIFLKDDSVSASGVTIGISVEDMKTALGEGYAETSAGTYVYTAKNGSTLKCIVRSGAVASIQLMTAKADS